MVTGCRQNLPRWTRDHDDVKKGDNEQFVSKKCVNLFQLSVKNNSIEMYFFMYKTVRNTYTFCLFALASGGLCPLDPLPGLRPWTPPGTYVPRPPLCAPR